MNLAALQHLVRAVANKKLGQNFVNFIVDVNNYRANRLNLLKEMALSFAKEVAENHQTETLEPMSAYERRIIHVTLSDYPGVKTESQGEGEERRIVIKPANDSSS
jgi:spoIIIJ-associated protein